MATTLTAKPGFIYFALEPQGKLAALFAGKLNKALAEKADDSVTASFAKRYIELFNQKTAREAITYTTFTRSGSFSAQGAVQMYTAREGRRQTPAILRLKLDRKIAPIAAVQEEGREQTAGTIGISESGRKFSLTGGKLRFIPLFTYFARRPMTDAWPMRHQYVVGRKVFKKKGLSFVLAYKKRAGEAFNAARRAAKKLKGSKSQRASRASTKTKAVWEAMYMIIAGGTTGIPGISLSRYAKNKRSPGKWFSYAVGITSDEVMTSMGIELEQDLPFVLAQVLGLSVGETKTTFFNK